MFYFSHSLCPKQTGPCLCSGHWGIKAVVVSMWRLRPHYWGRAAFKHGVGAWRWHMPLLLKSHWPELDTWFHQATREQEFSPSCCPERREQPYDDYANSLLPTPPPLASHTLWAKKLHSLFQTVVEIRKCECPQISNAS